MNTEATNSWYLQKHEDETLFGPITLDQLNAIAGRHGTRHQELEQ